MGWRITRKLVSVRLISVGLLFSILVLLPAMHTLAGSGEDKKKPTLKDAVKLTAPNRIEAKRGFRLVRKDDSTVQVFKKNVVIGTVKCGVCPGGTCSPVVKGNAALCTGCGSSTGRDCMYDPF